MNVLPNRVICKAARVGLIDVIFQEVNPLEFTLAKLLMLADLAAKS